MAYQGQHNSDPLAQYVEASASAIAVPGVPGTGAEHLKLLQQLVSSFALTNRLLAVSFGPDGGVADRRNGMPFYIDLGVEIPIPNAGGPSESYTPVASIDTSKIAQMITPTLGSNNVRFTIGVDSFSVHRTPGAPTRPWPISVLAPSLQSVTGSRYLTLLSGDSGNALSGTASSVLFDELPSSFSVTLGFLDPIPTDASGTLSSSIYPLVYNAAWEAEALAAGVIPVIPGTATTLWTSSNIYAVTLRLYVIPTITARTRLMEGSNQPM